jgi:hypothetical protein
MKTQTHLKINKNKKSFKKFFSLSFFECVCESRTSGVSGGYGLLFPSSTSGVHENTNTFKKHKENKKLFKFFFVFIFLIVFVIQGPFRHLTESYPCITPLILQALSGDLESQTHSKNIKKTKNFLNFFSFLFF